MFQSFAPGGVGDGGGVGAPPPCEAEWVAAGVGAAAGALARLPDALEARRAGGGESLPRRSAAQRAVVYGILDGVRGGGGARDGGVGRDSEFLAPGELAVAAEGILRAGWGVYVRSGTNDFRMLHCATGGYCLSKVLAWLPRADALRAMVHFGAGVVLLHFLAGRPPLAPAPCAPELPPWPEMVAAAVASRDVHTMKLVAQGAEIAGALPTSPRLPLPAPLDLGDLPRAAACQRLAARRAAVAAGAGAGAPAAVPASGVLE